MTSSNKSMINHLRDMFNGSFDEDLIESVLIQRDWNGTTKIFLFRLILLTSYKKCSKIF